jgi:hypothetical protein
MNFGKLKRLIAICLIAPFFILPLLISLLSIIPQVVANPVGITIWHPFIFLELFILFIITFIIESLIIRVFLKPVGLKETTRKFYKSVFAVNLVTFPLTQLFAFLLNRPYFFDFSYFLFVSIAIEVFPITLECLLNLKIYNKFNEKFYFEYRINNMNIIKSTITANLATFVIGFAIFLIY